MKKTAVAIICHNRRLLFLKRDNLAAIPEPNKWQLPGGHIEKNETPGQAIRRELEEEVSFIPSKLMYVGSVKILFRETHVFWSYVNGMEAKKFKLGDTEGQEIEFMLISEALGYDLARGIRFYLTDFRDLIERHIENKSFPSAGEIGKVNWLKILFFELFT